MSPADRPGSAGARPRSSPEAGAAVVVHGLTENVDETVDAIREAGGSAVGITGDVALEEDTHRRRWNWRLPDFGRLDHLVTSAGIQTYGDAATTTPRTSTACSR